MSIPVRPILTATVSVITAGAIAFAPSVKPPPPPTPTTQLAASVSSMPQPQIQPAALTFDPVQYLADFGTRIVIPPSLGAPFPTPQFPPVVAPTSIGSTLTWAYNAIEPWVRWGFEVAAYAVGWIPFVGWLAPQIMIFYNLGERIVRSGVFNTADWLDGRGSFWQNLGQFGVDTINSFIFFANDQLAFWLPGLPPLPPLPPIFGLAAQQAVTTSAQAEFKMSESTADVPENTSNVTKAGAPEVVEAVTETPADVTAEVTAEEKTVPSNDLEATEKDSAPVVDQPPTDVTDEQADPNAKADEEKNGPATDDKDVSDGTDKAQAKPAADDPAPQSKDKPTGTDKGKDKERSDHPKDKVQAKKDTDTADKADKADKRDRAAKTASHDDAK